MISNVNSLGMPSAQVGLYNGNITAMATDIAYMATIGADRVVANTYKYDQLNRINNSYYNKYSGGAWVASSAFGTSYSYDMNGNIRHLNRYEGTGTLFDQLSYNYSVLGAGGSTALYSTGRLATNNQLNYVGDNITANVISTDIKSGQAASNYQYDGIGNLISDVSENNLQVTWNVYGKIKSIRKGASAPYTWLDFSYDGAGNRVSKYVGTIDGSGNIAYTNKTTYIRDASGNIMATYDDKQVAPASGSNPAQWATSAEYPMYGSSRLGVYNQSISNPLQATNADNPSWLGSYKRMMRLKNYELSDHLGNVLTVITDLKRGINDGSGNLKYYSADVVSATDYYPFGMQMPGRIYNGGGYKFGFNGKENDNEVEGTGNWQDYGMRLYSSRLGRFPTVDPLTKKYPELSTYQFASNCPISGVDQDGKEYLDNNESRIKIMNGEIHIDLQNCNTITRNIWTWRDANEPSPIGYIGFPTKIGEIKAPRLEKTEDVASLDRGYSFEVKPYENPTVFNKEGTKLDGTKDRRVKAAVNNPVTTPGPKIAVAVTIVVGAAVWGLEQLGEGVTQRDYNKINEHVHLLRTKVFSDINTAIKRNIITGQYQDKASLGEIAAFVLSGKKSENKEINKIGFRIVTEISKNYRYPKSKKQ